MFLMPPALCKFKSAPATQCPVLVNLQAALRDAEKRGAEHESADTSEPVNKDEGAEGCADRANDTECAQQDTDLVGSDGLAKNETAVVGRHVDTGSCERPR